MLVLTRKPGEEIQIGGNVTVTVLLTSRNKVRLGISGPSEVRVLRGELLPIAASHEEKSLRAGVCINNMRPR